MNILYILGNGFDLAQGMATSYSDFYNYLRGADIKSQSLKQMRTDIDENITEWSDMEIALGEFSSEVQTPEEFIEMFDELNDHLQEYLSGVEQVFESHILKQDRFMKRFFNPFEFLEDSDKEQFKKFKDGIDNKSRFRIDAMTFNYTNTLEKMRVRGMEEWEHVGITHVHGQLGDTIVFGVDAVEQISNDNFRDIDGIKDRFVKRITDSACRRDNERICTQLISDANVIILYGVSLGLTDDHWWKLIGEQLSTRRNLAVILHLYVKEIEKTKQYKKNEYEKENKKRILERFGLEDKEDNDNPSRFFFVYNSVIFNLEYEFVRANG